MSDTDTPASTNDVDAEDVPEIERHVVREPQRVEGGFQAGFAVVEVGEDVIAFESFLYNEDDEAVITQDPIAVEKEAALLAQIPLSKIFKRDYGSKDE